MATLQSALADPRRTPAQGRAAYRVMMGYILGLSDESLAENLSTIVVSEPSERERCRLYVHVSTEHPAAFLDRTPSVPFVPQL